MTYRYLNNWQQDIELLDSADSAVLDLPDGRYRLVLRDDERTRFEVVDAAVAGGEADLSRGLEGTDQQDWPAGSVIYMALTAEQITNLQGLVGDGSPQGVVVAPLGTTYINDLDGGVWVCVWSDGVEADWLPQEPRGIVSPITESLGLSIPVNGEWLLSDGAAIEFTFAEVIHSNVPITGSPRRFESTGVTHIRVRQIDQGGGITLIATPLNQF